MTAGGLRRRGLLAFATLATAWIAVPAAVPLYDGLSFPDEPYRFVAPPAGYQHTAQPRSARGSSPAADGTNTRTIYVNTDEQAPQVNVVIPNRLLALTAAARTVTVTVVPLAPDRQPSKGTIDGNVYRVSALSEPLGSVTFAPPPGDLVSTSLVVLRATIAKKPAPSFLYRATPAQPWRAVTTFTTGNDIYRSEFAGFGDYALAFNAAAPGHHGSSGVQILASVLLVLVLLAVGTVLTVRVTRRPPA